jgi:murein DD-endopeptidase MepM/ murein hydrolase activator NlpD
VTLRGAALVLVLALATLAPGFAATSKTSALDAKIKAQQAKLHEVHLKLNAKRDVLGVAQAKVGTIAEQLAIANRNISSVQGQIAFLNAKMHTTESNLSFTKVRLAAAQKTLARHNDALKRRLIQAYEYGDLGYLAVLLQARSFGDFLERWNDISYVVKANEATIRQRRADAEHVEAIEGGLVADETSLRNARAAADQQQLALSGLAKQRANLLEVAQSEKRDVAVEVGQLEDTSAAAEAALEALVHQKQQEDDARRASARRAALLAGESLPPEPGAPGQLLWPVSGPITSPFGMRMHPVYGRPILHAGIDIAAAQGTTIAAAAEGRVIVAGYQGDCGKMVALAHSGGLSTIYCHMSQIFVGVGQDVQRGQAIGAVGMTGDATGPHVHFQVMQDGHPVDPMSFLR